MTKRLQYVSGILTRENWKKRTTRIGLVSSSTSWVNNAA